jgi:Recombinase
MTNRVRRLACTRKQAAEALGVSLATLDRRVIPAIETVRTEWGSRLIPVDELERYLADRRQEVRAARRRSARPGRKPGLEPEVVARIRSEYASRRALGEIARQLNADGVRTSQGGRQWWPSTVRAVLVRSRPLNSARSTADSA